MSVEAFERLEHEQRERLSREFIATATDVALTWSLPCIKEVIRSGESEQLAQIVRGYREGIMRHGGNAQNLTETTGDLVRRACMNGALIQLGETIESGVYGERLFRIQPHVVDGLALPDELLAESLTRLVQGYGHATGQTRHDAAHLVSIFGQLRAEVVHGGNTISREDLIRDAADQYLSGKQARQLLGEDGRLARLTRRVAAVVPVTAATVALLSPSAKADTVSPVTAVIQPVESVAVNDQAEVQAVIAEASPVPTDEQVDTSSIAPMQEDVPVRSADALEPVIPELPPSAVAPSTETMPESPATTADPLAEQPVLSAESPSQRLVVAEPEAVIVESTSPADTSTPEQASVIDDISSLLAASPYEVVVPSPAEGLPERHRAVNDTRDRDEIIQRLEISERKKQFLTQLVDAAAALQAQDTRVNVRVLVAQAIKESGWGRSGLAVQHNNLFGMKAGSSWRGKTAGLMTSEYTAGGTHYRTKATWRVYDSYEESIKDYADHFIGRLDHYKDALRYTNNDEKYLDGLLAKLDRNGHVVIRQGHEGAGSYATDPHYKEGVLDLIKTYRIDELLPPTETRHEASRPAGWKVAGDAHDYRRSQSKESAPRTPIKEALKAAGYENGRLDERAVEKLGDKWGEVKLHKDAADAFRKMSDAFEAEFGRPLQFVGPRSGYRSYAQQVEIKEEAKRKKRPQMAATPGYSNHGWGLAVDLEDLGGFDGKEYQWMLEHAIKYGYVHPYFARESGSAPEPWHWEYNGQ